MERVRPESGYEAQSPLGTQHSALSRGGLVIRPRLGLPRPPAPELRERVAALGYWFHNINLAGVWTNPAHFLGDYPASRWRSIQSLLPEDLTGQTVLDIGCNAGYFSFACKERGAARVVAVDSDRRYLEQARFAAEVLRQDVEFRLLSVYDIDQLACQFDYVLFLGVFYHLRHPLLALDKIAVLVRKRLIFQSMLRGPLETKDVAANYPIDQHEVFHDLRFPLMYFIERYYADDPTNWWIPNRSGMEAMLRSAGLRIVASPDREIYACEPAADDDPTWPRRWHVGRP